MLLQKNFLKVPDPPFIEQNVEIYEITSAFEVREDPERDFETESGSEWAASVSCRANRGGVVEKLRSGKPSDDGFAKRNFNIYDPILCENLLAAHGRKSVLGITPGQPSAKCHKGSPVGRCCYR